MFNKPTESSNTSHLESSSVSKKYRSLIKIYETCRFSLIAIDLGTFEETSDKVEWKKLHDRGDTTINKNESWVLCDFPFGNNSVGLKWIFKTKF